MDSFIVRYELSGLTQHRQPSHMVPLNRYTYESESMTGRRTKHLYDVPGQVVLARRPVSASHGSKEKCCILAHFRARNVAVTRAGKDFSEGSSTTLPSYLHLGKTHRMLIVPF